MRKICKRLAKAVTLDNVRKGDNNEKESIISRCSYRSNGGNDCMQRHAGYGECPASCNPGKGRGQQ